MAKSRARHDGEGHDPDRARAHSVDAEGRWNLRRRQNARPDQAKTTRQHACIGQPVGSQNGRRWLAQQQQKLRVFVRLMGTAVEKGETIQAAIERAEKNERDKYLEMDVDVIFTLRDIRGILEKLISMENILKELEEVCRRRSEQIIAPSWEAKGSL